MSKKKTKTRSEKEQKVHHLEHVANSNVIVVKSDKTTDETVKAPRKAVSSPLDKYIKRDLRSSLIIIAIFVVLIIGAAFLVHQTGFLNPLLSRWNIKY